MSCGKVVNTFIVSFVCVSLNIDFTAKIVCDMFMESSVTMEGIDYEEICLYLSIN